MHIRILRKNQILANRRTQPLAPQRFSSVSSSDSLDWKDLPADQIVKRVTEKVQPGSIVLFHNAAKHTPEALPAILETLLQEGYLADAAARPVRAGLYHRLHRPSVPLLSRAKSPAQLDKADGDLYNR